MSIYTEETFIKLKKDTDKFLHVLQECKYSGSWDTKVDINIVIKMISNYQFIVDVLRRETKELEEKSKTLNQTETKWNA